MLRGHLGVVTNDLELVEDCVLAFLLPVVEEYALEQLAELRVRGDALREVDLREELDVERERAL